MGATVEGQQDADRRLLCAVAAGDESALEGLYVRHGPALLAYAEGLLTDRHRAEETVQDTLLAVWRGADSFQGRSTVRTWLFGICRRQALRRMGVRGGPVHVPIDAAVEVAADEPGPEAVTLARADARTVAAAMRTLPAIHREVLDLAFGAGLTRDEIAVVLDVPVGTVKSRLFHARAVLARALADGTEDAPAAAQQAAGRGGRR
ncbi:RNA polymerase sigma factor [Micromonospora costi]|uniref:Sigma-70 family RNA polymerase sigma factor n=1 Tax=Micromonospora costi TaxID=1530042 RepID=A0A3A9ZXE7_9ACTN|nr:sigma-70 family RNA polymerase sigma factor [Micromonospora costi]RKN52965.1 sigma-70 family RNA polymerase sigma factor [Micromonospora costi]